MKPITVCLPIVLILALLGGCAGKASQKAEAKGKWDAARAGVLYSLAENQFQSGNFAKCRQSLDEAARLAPKNAAVHILSAKLAVEQGQLEFAERELAVARECDPKNPEADFLSGVVYQRWRKTEIAYQFYTKASDKAPAELAYVLARAEMLIAMDRQVEALTLLQEKVAYFENSPAIRDAVGQLLVAQGRHKEAVETLRQASILAEDDMTIREHLGLALYYAKDYRDADDVLGRLTKAPAFATRADLLLALGECQMELGKWRDARATFESAVQMDSASSQLWLCLAKVALQVNDTRRAEMSLAKALTLEPADPEANLLQGYLYLRQERLADALGCFRKANALNGGDTVSLCMVGYVLEKTGQPDKAMKCYGEALRLKPGDELATRLMATLELQE